MVSMTSHLRASHRASVRRGRPCTPHPDLIGPISPVREKLEFHGAEARAESATAAIQAGTFSHFWHSDSQFPTRLVGQTMMTRLAMGAPPSRSCPLLSSVHKSAMPCRVLPAHQKALVEGHAQAIETSVCADFQTTYPNDCKRTMPGHVPGSKPHQAPCHQPGCNRSRQTGAAPGRSRT